MINRFTAFSASGALLLAAAVFGTTANAQIISIQNATGGATLNLSDILDGKDPLTIPFNSSTPNWNVLNNTGSAITSLTLIFDGGLASNAQLNCQEHGAFGGPCTVNGVANGVKNPGIVNPATLVFSGFSVASGGTFQINTASFAHSGQDGGCIAGVPDTGTGSGAGFVCTAVPEPASLSMFMGGGLLLGGAFLSRRRIGASA